MDFWLGSLLIFDSFLTAKVNTLQSQNIMIRSVFSLLFNTVLNLKYKQVVGLNNTSFLT